MVNRPMPPHPSTWDDNWQDDMPPICYDPPTDEFKQAMKTLSSRTASVVLGLGITSMGALYEFACGRNFYITPGLGPKGQTAILELLHRCLPGGRHG